MNLAKSSSQKLGNLGEPSQPREPSSCRGAFRTWLGAAVQGVSSLPTHQNHPNPCAVILWGSWNVTQGSGRLLVLSHHIGQGLSVTLEGSSNNVSGGTQGAPERGLKGERGEWGNTPQGRNLDTSDQRCVH